AKSQHQVINTTNASSTLNDGIEHWLHVRWRPTDDAEHLSCRRLMLQGLAEFGVALLDLFEQADILNSDDRLISEGPDELDLPLGKRLNEVTPNYDSSDTHSLSQQWY